MNAHVNKDKELDRLNKLLNNLQYCERTETKCPDKIDSLMTGMLAGAVIGYEAKPFTNYKYFVDFINEFITYKITLIKHVYNEDINYKLLNIKQGKEYYGNCVYNFFHDSSLEIRFYSLCEIFELILEYEFKFQRDFGLSYILPGMDKPVKFIGEDVYSYYKDYILNYYLTRENNQYYNDNHKTIMARAGITDLAVYYANRLVVSYIESLQYNLIEQNPDNLNNELYIEASVLIDNINNLTLEIKNKCININKEERIYFQKEDTLVETNGKKTIKDIDELFDEVFNDNTEDIKNKFPDIYEKYINENKNKTLHNS